jgi:hypothetical protein
MPMILRSNEPNAREKKIHAACVAEVLVDLAPMNTPTISDANEAPSWKKTLTSCMG